MVPSSERSSGQFSRGSFADAHRYSGYSSSHHDAGHEVGTLIDSPTCRPGFNVHRPRMDNVMCRSSYDSPFSATSSLIDNSILVYIPIRLPCGVTVHCRADVLARCPSVLRDLNNDVEGCLDVLPTSVHALVRRTKIWVNTTYYYGLREKPRNVNHSTAHHHEGWLFWCVVHSQIPISSLFCLCRVSYSFVGHATYQTRPGGSKYTTALITKRCDCTGKEAVYCCTNSVISFISLPYRMD